MIMISFADPALFTNIDEANIFSKEDLWFQKVGYIRSFNSCKVSISFFCSVGMQSFAIDSFTTHKHDPGSGRISTPRCTRLITTLKRLCSNFCDKGNANSKAIYRFTKAFQPALSFPRVQVYVVLHLCETLAANKLWDNSVQDVFDNWLLLFVKLKKGILSTDRELVKKGELPARSCKPNRSLQISSGI